MPPNYPQCPCCEHSLCFLERTYDNCSGCNTPLPEAIKLDFDFAPLVKP